MPDGSDQRFVGSANVTVANVTPHGPPVDSNRGVTFVVDVAWGSPLNICTDIAIAADRPNAVVYVGPQTQSRQTMANPVPPVRKTLESRVAPSYVHSATATTRS